MNTKKHILLTALNLFNKKGFEHVSTYDIAQDVGISQGNLTYHFPTKMAMINLLAKQMIAEIDEEILTIDSDFSFINFSSIFEKEGQVWARGYKLPSENTSSYFDFEIFNRPINEL